MLGALIRIAERWKSIRVTEFEGRQLSAVKTEPDQEYEVQVGLDRKPSKAASRKYPAAFRLNLSQRQAIREWTSHMMTS